MARRVGFHVYSVAVRRRYSSELEVLSNVSGTTDLLETLEIGFQEEVNAHANDAAAQRVARLERLDKFDRHLTGLIEAGSYGEAATIVHTESGKLIHKQTTDQASVMPCFFRLVIGEGKTRGLLVLQRDNRVPAKQALAVMIRKYVADLNEELICDIVPLMNKETFEKLVDEGDVQQITFTKLSLPPDLATFYDSGYKETKGATDVVFRAIRNERLPLKQRFKQWASAETSGKELFEIPDLENFDYDKITAKVNINGRLQKVDLGKKLTMPIIDLTDSLKTESGTGHPTYESLITATSALIGKDMFDAYSE